MKSGLNVRFAEVNDSHHAFTILCKARHALVNDAFAKMDKVVIESQLVGFFIDGLYHDFLRMKVMKENP